MSMRKLVYEYKQSIWKMKAAYEAADPEDKKIIGGMIRDMEYAVKWMESGRDPGRMHMDADESRVYYYDPFVLDNIGHSLYPREWNDNPYNDEKVNSFLGACLTKREEDVYRLYIGEGLSMAKIGELLHIAKTSVQNLIERAEWKIDAERDQGRLF
ncbi:MAG: polymerase sigma factor, sigma-70 family protein [Bacillus sp. (in: firmicutes)]|jgi:RNA polymerase sigma-70 factor (ECF subfamily)|nr:polymerase sigma factor, sigma-70 family protein [Bacillales bacterium]MDF2904362.1 polymerase sigma factor, sigma-70 family protein [Bacillus sp. (in: firmicutes)]